MAANIVSSAPSGRFYYGCAGAAGLLAGLAIVYWFPALASWWPSDLVRVYHAMSYVMGFGVSRIGDIPLVAYATLTLSGFVMAFATPGTVNCPLLPGLCIISLRHGRWSIGSCAAGYCSSVSW